MRLITLEVFSFDELNDAGKENARSWAREGDYHWIDESRHSIEHFCSQFGIRLKDWSIDTYHGYSYKVEANNDDFRGLTFERAKRMKLSDGYYIGETMQDCFIREFKEHGALKAFDMAVNHGFNHWLDDLRFQETDEYIDDFIIGNNYEFYAHGELA